MINNHNSILNYLNGYLYILLDYEKESMVMSGPLAEWLLERLTPFFSLCHMNKCIESSAPIRGEVLSTVP